jgi:tetratricopeptide (TPR) repeat protein
MRRCRRKPHGPPSVTVESAVVAESTRLIWNPMTPPAQPRPHAAELLVEARAALVQGGPAKARELALRALQLDPDQPEGRCIAGLAALALRQLPEALDHLHRAASAMPRHAPYAVHFARALAAAHRTGDALQVANIALGLAPDDPLLLHSLGTTYTQCHAPERAAAVFRQAAALAPDNPACRFSFATSLIFSGDVAQAETELEACLALAPGHWRAHDTLSRIRRQTPAHNHIERLLSLLADVVDDSSALMHTHMALSKEYEDVGDFAKAFEHLVLGKSAVKAATGYTIDRDRAIVEALINAFPEPRPQTTGHPSGEPIFVMGLPRTGTTLVERILSSHPEVYAAGELENFGVALERLSGANSPVMLSPGVIHRAGRISWETLGEIYIASTRPATCLKPRFIDKLPHNFLYAGFIANALPNARIICLRRNPLDSCLSNFREPFSETSPLHGYSFDLLDTGRYYVLFDRLMTHWKQVLPGRILEMDYETLVTTQEASTRQLLEHCGLPWNEACLHFERNQAPSTTASSVQVRAPMHRDAVRRWTKYGKQLEELRSLLTEAGIDCDR